MVEEPDKSDGGDRDQGLVGAEGNAPIAVLPGEDDVDQRGSRQQGGHDGGGQQKLCNSVGRS